MDAWREPVTIYEGMMAETESANLCLYLAEIKALFRSDLSWPLFGTPFRRTLAPISLMGLIRRSLIALLSPVSQVYRTQLQSISSLAILVDFLHFR